MNKLSKLLLVFGFIVSLTIGILVKTNSALTMPETTSTPVIAQNIAQTIDFAKYFQQSGVEGSIIIYDPQSDRTYQYNQQRNQTAFLPGSTFKILNSLISLETGVIDNQLAILTWDGISRPLVPEWNQDLNMKEAFKLSAVWFYQVLARRVGYEKMQTLVRKSDYGNQNIGSLEDIDNFWLTGKLRITPQSQIEFLQRFNHKELPFSERSLSIVKDIMIVEQTPEYTIRAKTGWVGFEDPTKPQIGWYVGYLEKGKEVYFFATNIDIRDDNDPAARIDLTRRCFEELKLL
jgi:beta-lactamase class D